MPPKSSASHPEEWHNKIFFRLLPKVGDESVRKANQREMNQILNTLRIQKTKKVDFSGLWSTLFWVPILKSRIRHGHQALSEFLDHTGETTQRTLWARKRNKILRDTEKLTGNVFSLYEELHNPEIYRLLARFRKNNRPIFGPNGLTTQDQRVLKALRQLNTAIIASPIFQSPSPSRPRGHQPEPWLKEAKKRFKEYNVPQETGDQLLRLIGVKPDSPSRNSHSSS